MGTSLTSERLWREKSSASLTVWMARWTYWSIWTRCLEPPHPPPPPPPPPRAAQGRVDPVGDAPGPSESPIWMKWRFCSRDFSRDLMRSLRSQTWRIMKIQSTVIITKKETQVYPRGTSRGEFSRIREKGLISPARTRGAAR